MTRLHALLGRLLCWLGFHRYRTQAFAKFGDDHIIWERVCTRCWTNTKLDNPRE